ncbi:MAG: alpha/beta hydrolase [Dehalococcoidia bacterium]|nr:alpha/beta hydrolase [Dehalococcoidia bacterium]
MPKVKVNGINLYYESTGKGYPLVLTHGFSATHAMWKVQEPLANEYRLITCDVRGHGETDSPPTADQYSADIVVEDLFQLMKTLNIRKAVFGGLSMGGYISLRFYLKHPEMVTALIVMDTGPGYRNPARMAEWNRSREDMARRLETEGIDVLVAQAATEGRREIALNQNPVGLAHMSRKVVGQHDSWVIENLDKIKVPTLVVVGEKDTAFLQAADYMAKVIPGAKRVTVPNAGHPANIDNTPFFNQAILDFLKTLNLKSG